MTSRTPTFASCDSFSSESAAIFPGEVWDPFAGHGASARLRIAGELEDHWPGPHGRSRHRHGPATAGGGWLGATGSNYGRNQRMGIYYGNIP